MSEPVSNADGPTSTTHITDYERAVAILKHMYDRRLSRGKKLAMTPPGLNKYEPISTDVIVTTSIKAGTTLGQYMTCLIGQVSGKNKSKEFNDINELAPWVDVHMQMKTPIPEPSDECQLRVLKSHSFREIFVKAKKTVQKHLIIIRDPLQLPSSLLDFLFNSWTADYTKDVEALKSDQVREEMLNLFADSELLRNYIFSKDVHDLCFPAANWFGFINSWLKPNQHANSLVLFYEEIVQDLQTAIKRIASFTGCQLTNDQVETIAKLCSRETMLNDKRFSGNANNRTFASDDKSATVSRVKQSRSDGFKGYKLKQDIIDGVNRRFEEEYGVSSYDQFKTLVSNKQKQLYGL